MRTYTPLRVTLPKPITQVVAAGHHGLALAADGTVLTWGDLPKPAFFIRPQVQWFF